MNPPPVVIVDYGLGNLFSIVRALQKVGVSDARISDEKGAIEKADRLILPGVGAFGDGMRNLRERDLLATIESYAASGRPLMGVCLGMQLLMSASEEFGLHDGLNLVPGRVRQLHPGGNGRVKVPQIGWNSLHPAQYVGGQESPWSGTVLRAFEDGSYMYFLHSYVVVPDDPGVCLATTVYGNDSFCSVLKRGNITGVQFHPERSGEEGLIIYKNFVHEN